MNDLDPAGDATIPYHEIIPLRRDTTKAGPSWHDVVGPICESTDTFAKDRQIQVSSARANTSH